MKRIHWITAALSIAFLLGACSKEKRMNNKVLGTWQVEKMVYTHPDGTTDEERYDDDDSFLLDFKDWQTPDAKHMNVVYKDQTECYYLTEDKGDKIVICEDPDNVDDAERFSIVLLNKKEFVLKTETGGESMEIFMKRKGD